MSGRPYFAEGLNLCNELVYTTTPASYGPNGVTVTQAHERRVMDTDNSSIYGQNAHPNYPGAQYGNCQPKSILKSRSAYDNSPSNYLNSSPNTNQNVYGFSPNPPPHYASNHPGNVNVNAYNFNPNCNQNQNQYQENRIFIPQRHVIPGGVTYTFDPAAQQYALRNFNQFSDTCANCWNPPLITPPYIQQSGFQPEYQYQPPPQPSFPQTIPQSYMQPPPPIGLTLQQQIALKNLEKHSLEVLLLEEHMRNNPFQMRFHQDGQTDTLDLYGGHIQIPPSRGTPDFRNICGVVAQNNMNQPQEQQPQCSCTKPVPECPAKKLNLVNTTDVDMRHVEVNVAEETKPESSNQPKPKETNEAQKEKETPQKQFVSTICGPDKQEENATPCVPPPSAKATDDEFVSACDECQNEECNKKLFLIGKQDKDTDDELEQKQETSIYDRSDHDKTIWDLALDDEEAEYPGETSHTVSTYTDAISDESISMNNTSGTSNTNKVRFHNTHTVVLPKPLKKYGNKLKKYVKKKVVEHLNQSGSSDEEYYSSASKSSDDEYERKHRRKPSR